MYGYLDRVHMRNALSVGRNATNEIANATGRTRREFDDIDDRIDRLTLMCEAMWSLMEENTTLTTDDLERRIYELDGVDGRHDGRRQRVAQRCECGSMVPVSSLICQYCGAPAVRLSPFDAV